MKKIFTLALLAMTAMGAQAQEYNLFPAEDVDADGWLWLNTQEKIDKYVGIINEDDYTVDPNGKIIQMAYANITPDYPATVADPEAYGVDTNGNYLTDEGVNKDECIKGGIILAPASAQMSSNGGCLVLNLPSCSTIGLLLSSEFSMLGRTLMLSPTNAIDNDNSVGDNDPWTGDTKVIFSKATLFDKIHNYGQYKWETVATDNARSPNGNLNFVSDSPVYFAYQNCHRYPVYVHAIKVTTPRQESAGISNVATGKAPAVWHNLAGMQVKDPSNGIFIKDGKAVIVR